MKIQVVEGLEDQQSDCPYFFLKSQQNVWGYWCGHH